MVAVIMWAGLVIPLFTLALSFFNMVVASSNLLGRVKITGDGKLTLLISVLQIGLSILSIFFWADLLEIQTVQITIQVAIWGISSILSLAVGIFVLQRVLKG